MSETITLAADSDPSFLPRLDRKLARTIVRRPATLHSERAIVTFSFDDISRNAATVGAKILEDEDARGTFFVAGGLMGKQFGPWQFAELPEIVALHTAGHEVGSHTLSHPDCQLLSRAGLRDETAKNAAILEAAMPGLKLASFAYPYGSVGCWQKRMMMQEFACSRGTHPDINAKHFDIGQLNSFTLNDERTPVARIAKLIEQTKAASGWLMFHTHDVCEAPTPEDVSPALLRAALELARAADCQILPIRDAMKYVHGKDGVVARTA
ncbi:MAG: peptidoglycan/xylan/chitin deacetylase (PgdA/CDA1 family) [Hyphomicrobiaceae bacterium]|jgi:peptidoglycan/xylan/chitin deacetylase (PgdA/CDA1 family)